MGFSNHRLRHRRLGLAHHLDLHHRVAKRGDVGVDRALADAELGALGAAGHTRRKGRGAQSGLAIAGSGVSPSFETGHGAVSPVGAVRTHTRRNAPLVCVAVGVGPPWR